MSVRDRVLDAYEEMLVVEGERATTLDAVAQRAAVSKGGLLYHFGTKEALVDGLVERLGGLADADAEAMAAAPQGAAAYYVGTSVHEGTAFDRSLVATLRLAQEANPTAREAVVAIQRRCYELILTDVGEPATAHAILLLGDGLYYNAALLGAGPDEPLSAAAGAQRAGLLGVVEQLKQQAAARG